MNAPYFGYIAAAYGITGTTLAWLVLHAWWQGRVRARRLKALEDG